MFQGYGYYMIGMHAFWWVFWLAVVALFVWAALARRYPRGESPRELLRRRLAAGEVTSEEYQQRMALLNRDC